MSTLPLKNLHFYWGNDMYTGKMRGLEALYKRLCNLLPWCIQNYRHSEEVNHVFCSLQFFKIWVRKGAGPRKTRPFPEAEFHKRQSQSQGGRKARLTDSRSGIVRWWEKTVLELKRNGWLEAEVWMVEKPQERLCEKTQGWAGKPMYDEVWRPVWHGTFHTFQKLD